MEFTSSGLDNTETTKVKGNLETMHRLIEYGLMFTEEWNNTALSTLTPKYKTNSNVELSGPLILPFQVSLGGEGNDRKRIGYKREKSNRVVTWILYYCAFNLEQSVTWL